MTPGDFTYIADRVEECCMSESERSLPFRDLISLSSTTDIRTFEELNSTLDAPRRVSITSRNLGRAFFESSTMNTSLTSLVRGLSRRIVQQYGTTVDAFLTNNGLTVGSYYAAISNTAGHTISAANIS